MERRITSTIVSIPSRKQFSMDIRTQRDGGTPTVGEVQYPWMVVSFGVSAGDSGSSSRQWANLERTFDKIRVTLLGRSCDLQLRLIRIGK